MEHRELGNPQPVPAQLPPPAPASVPLPPFPSPVELLVDQIRRMRAAMLTGGEADAITPAVQRWNKQLLDEVLPL